MESVRAVSEGALATETLEKDDSGPTPSTTVAMSSIKTGKPFCDDTGTLRIASIDARSPSNRIEYSTPSV